MDKSYDIRAIYEGCEDRDVRPIIPLRQTPASRRTGTRRRRASTASGGSPEPTTAAKWRCPTGECNLAFHWIKAERLFPLMPRETPRWRKLYTGRAAIEREFGRLKNDWACHRSASVA